MTFAKEITVEALEIDPYPIYERLRREAPVAYVPVVNLWFVTRFKDVELVSKSPELFTAEVASSPLDRTWGKPTILTTDGPVHKNLRSGVDPKISPEAGGHLYGRPRASHRAGLPVAPARRRGRQSDGRLF